MILNQTAKRRPVFWYQVLMDHIHCEREKPMRIDVAIIEKVLTDFMAFRLRQQILR